MPGRTGHRLRRAARTDRASWLAALTARVRAGEYVIDPDRIAMAIMTRMREVKPRCPPEESDS